MEMLLAILLWIGCISAPNTYHQTQIDAYTVQNQPVINTVLDNEAQQMVIWQQYGVAATEIEVIEPYN